jgi:hypothetical protein
MLKPRDDIRRRLTIAEVPEPPADLAQKIKHEIPKHFTSMTAKEVERKPREASPLWSFWGMSWQLAAAILVLIGLTWAVFEAYQSELTETTRIAEADSSATSVDEFEKRVTDDSDVIHVEGTAPVERIPTEGNETALGKTAPAAPVVGEAAPSERELDDRQASAARRDVPKRQAIAVETAPQPRAAEPAAEAREPTTPSAAATTEVAALKARSAVPPVTDSAAAPASGVAEEAYFAGARAPAREVQVEGLAVEQTVKVELTLDPSSGAVVDVKLPDGADRNVIEAVTEAARSWVFETKDSADRTSSSRTIDVTLKRK